MSERPSSRLSWLARMGLVTASLIGSLSIGGGSNAIAQDATPDASPMAECVPGEISAAPAASPSADMASPVAEPEPVGSPADEATTAEAQAFIDNLLACKNDPEAVATLFTPNLVMTFGGYASIEEALADGFFEELPFSDIEVLGVTSYDNGTVGVDVQYQQSQYQIASEEWILVQDGGAWKLDAFSSISAEVEGDTVAVGVQLGENEDGTYFITPNASSVVESEVLILQGTNMGAEPHEMVMLQLPEGADPMGLLDGSIAEEDITFIGVVFMTQTGDMAELTLVGLPAGEYVLVCFFPGPDGEPHAANGMVAPFSVTAPTE